MFGGLGCGHFLWGATIQPTEGFMACWVVAESSLMLLSQSVEWQRGV